MVKDRIEYQAKLHTQATTQSVSRRVGQALEIAVQRSIQTTDLEFLGAYTDLDAHDDATQYIKEEPPSSMTGRTIPGKQKLDFLVRSNSIWAGVEVKNIRPWVYPNSEEVKSLIQKCLHLDVVPVLIARRIPYVTNLILRTAGVITWETLRQRYPVSESELVAKISHKEALGYSDIVLGNQADPTLNTFFSKVLPASLVPQRTKFDENQDLLSAFASGDMKYPELAARLRRRSSGKSEDYDDEPADIPF